MKKRYVLVLIVFVILLYLIPSHRTNSIVIRFKYYKNAKAFEEVKKEMYKSDEDSIEISKDSDNNVFYIKIGNDKHAATSDDINYKYSECIKLMNNTNINYIQKDGNNIVINYYVWFNFAQEIVWMPDDKNFEHKYIILKKTNLKNHWYYVEEK